MTRKSPSHKSGFEGAVCKLSGYVSKKGLASLRHWHW